MTPRPAGKPDSQLPGAKQRVSYLRVSVTDRCNERCVYCMPAHGVPLKLHDDILRFEEIETIVRAAVPLGVRSVRLTGGEPLVRKGIIELAAGLAAIPGVDDLALTTNGVLLGELAVPLRQAGVRRLNVSLDTLRPDRYREITRRHNFDKACSGIRTAVEAGFQPVKVNTVVIRGLNDDEIESMALVAAGAAGKAAGPASPIATSAASLVWRFIELMPLGEGHLWGERALVPADEIVDRLADLAARHGLPFEEEGPLAPPFGAGPARYFKFGRGRVGVISPMTHGFCSRCNRLRLTSDGKIHPCLTSPLAVDLAEPLRAGASAGEIARLLAKAVQMKPQAHRMAERRPELSNRRMSQIGG